MANSILDNIIDFMKPKAHDAINNEINIETLKRIANSSNWLRSKALYQAETKGGETRHIFKDVGGPIRYDSPEDLQLFDLSLKQQIRQNPQFSDTLRTEDVQGIKKEILEAEGSYPLTYLKNWFKNLF